MPVLVQIVIASLLVSSLSLVGVLVLVLSQKRLAEVNLLLISLAAGTMMGGAFFHLLPESLTELEPRLVGLMTIVGFLVFFVLERLLHWHHCQQEEVSAGCSHPAHRFSVGYLNLVADLLHNFIDGLVIAAAFLTSPVLGVSTAIAVALHEIPQELGDFGVLLHAGFSSTKALLLNFLTAWSALAGALVGYFFLSGSLFNLYLLPLTAGGFLYIAASDLVPDIKHRVKTSQTVTLLVVFVLGLGLMWWL